MARQVLPIVGAVVGAYFGSPQLGYAIGAVVGGLVDPVVNQGPKIGETGAQTSQEGAPRAIVYGTAAVTGNIIACGPVIKSTETEESAGGKGAEKSQNEHAYRNYAIRICEGPIAGILRIWQDDKLVYDVRGINPSMSAMSAKWIANKNVFLGDETQLPSAFLNLNVPPLNDHPAYRGTAYIVFGLEDLTDRRGSIPQYRFEVATKLETIALTKVASKATESLGLGNGSFNEPVDPGLGGGSNFATSQVIESSGGIGTSGLLLNGNCYLCTWRFQGRGPGMYFTAYLKIGGSIVWSRNVSLSDGQYVLLRAQLNHMPDGTLVAIGAETTTDSQGYFNFSIKQLATATYDAFVPGGGTPPILYESEDPSFGVILDSGGNIFSAGDVNDTGMITPWGPSTFGNNEGSPMSLASVVADIHDRCGLDSDKFDVTELSDDVAGLVLAADYTGADAINTLRTPYFFDKAEYSKKLHYPKRGAAVVDTLTIDDLVEEPDMSKREQALEFPKKLHLFYQHAASGYAAVKATSARSSPDARVVGETSIQVPVVLNEDQAAQTAAKMHKISWAEAEGEVTFSVPSSLASLVPSDNIGLSLRGQTKRLRIEKIEEAAGIRNLTCRHDRQSAYTSNLTGVPIPLPTLPPSTIVGNTTLAILDISSRTDTEDDLNYLSAGLGSSDAWYGYALQRSLDGGASYTTVDKFDPAFIATLVDPLPTASEFYTDTTNTVRIKLIRAGQALEDLTDVQFLSEQGAFALEKSDGTWEVMQFRDVTDEGAGILALNTLHRGLLNSGSSAHIYGAKFVLLSRAEHIPAQSAWIGQPLTHRAASLGDSPEVATAQTTTYVGRSQLEWPVAYLTLARDMSNIVTGSWTPRHRFGTDDAPIASINFTGYRVTLTGTSTVTFDTTSPSFTYDTSTLGGLVVVSVSALNRITGAGPSTSGTI